MDPHASNGAGGGISLVIFLVLPFLSIIDQTAQVYGDVLGKPSTSTLMQSHSLSERAYDDTEEKDAEFFLDTWDSEIVVTTFDQFLLSLLGSRSRHQMRFHNLADAIVVFDGAPEQHRYTHVRYPTRFRRGYR